MANFGEAKEEVRCGFLMLTGGAPSHDTFSRIFHLLDLAQFDDLFQGFMAAFAATRAGVASTAQPRGHHGRGDRDRGPRDYPMALKANQPALHDDVSLMMDDPGARADGAVELVDADHGGIKTRRAEVLTISNG